MVRPLQVFLDKDVASEALPPYPYLICIWGDIKEPVELFV
jgi:hypothetical protein